MDDHDKYASLPIPTYEEAISSRPSSSQTHTGPEEISDDAERQGLLRQQNSQSTARRGRGGYRPPTVESARSSIDSDLYLPEVGEDDDEAELVRRDMEEMEIMDPDHSPSRLRTHFSKRISSLTHSLSTFRFPTIRLLPRSWSCPMPRLPEGLAIPLSVVARLFGLAIIAFSIYLLFHFNIIRQRNRMLHRYDPEFLRARVQGLASPDRIADSLRYITSYDHVAGTEGDLFLAEWVESKWKSSGLDQVDMVDYHVYLNYPTPTGRSVEILSPPESRFRAKLEEDNVFRASGQSRQQTLNWHGSSRSGNVTGHLVYANGGSREDFQKLNDMGVDLKGSIVLVKYYGTQGDRALKVKAAEMVGAVGCLIYSDPKDDGFVQGATYPDGPWRSEDSVQRGSVGLMSWVLGDYLTPGWASTKDAPRVSENDNPGLVNIPSLPLSWGDAQPLLQSIQGKGKRVPEDWVGGVPEVKEWWTGSNDGPIVWLQNFQEENKKQQIWNVRGYIQGIEMPDNRILVGNHRDSWCFGAVDPGSGSAVLMEVVRILGDLAGIGWRPLRSIEFLSWDAEEYNMIGSTEFVEDHMQGLLQNGVAYLNVDTGVAGDVFRASASPVYERVLMHVLNRVGDPHQNKTIKAIWEERKTKLGGLGSGSDYVAFQDLAGVSSIDFGFSGPRHGYPYHSCYETYEWMAKFGDPTFEYHGMMAQIWALLILELADAPILPFDFKAYAKAIHSYVDQLEHDASDMHVDFSSLKEAADVLTDNAKRFHGFEDYWTNQVLGLGGMESNSLAQQRILFNEMMVRFEKDLLDLPGMFPGDEKEQHGVSPCSAVNTMS